MAEVFVAGKRLGKTSKPDISPVQGRCCANVRLIATTINKRVAESSLPPMHALILNAGYQEHTEQYSSEDGLDMSLQCNYLSHWLLTLMLLQSMDKRQGGSSCLEAQHMSKDGKSTSVAGRAIIP